MGLDRVWDYLIIYLTMPIVCVCGSYLLQVDKQSHLKDEVRQKYNFGSLVGFWVWEYQVILRHRVHDLV